MWPPEETEKNNMVSDSCFLVGHPDSDFIQYPKWTADLGQKRATQRSMEFR